MTPDVTHVQLCLLMGQPGARYTGPISSLHPTRHCEERRDEAIQNTLGQNTALDRHAPLAMTPALLSRVNTDNPASSLRGAGGDAANQQKKQVIQTPYIEPHNTSVYAHPPLQGEGRGGDGLGIQGMRAPYLEPNNTSVYAQYTIQVENRDALIKKLNLFGLNSPPLAA